MQMKLIVSFIAIAISFFGVGCSRWETASNIYKNNPDLKDVRMYSGKRSAKPDNLGLVYADGAGSTCDEAVADALRKMLGEAKALGGSSVSEVQFKISYRWTGEPYCRTKFSNSETHGRGYAMP